MKYKCHISLEETGVMVIRPLASTQTARLHDSVVGQVHIINWRFDSILVEKEHQDNHCKSSVPYHDVIGSLTVWNVVTKQGTDIEAESHIAVPTQYRFSYSHYSHYRIALPTSSLPCPGSHLNWGNSDYITYSLLLTVWITCTVNFVVWRT